MNQAALKGSLMTFIRVFFELKTGREFVISRPKSRESHFITIAKALKSVFKGDINRLIINVPPGHAKSTMMVYFTAWAMAHYPDSNFLYISYAYELAEKHTSTIKEIMSMPEYKEMFGVELMSDSKAKGSFKTTAGGSVKAFGSTGAITGQDAGLPNLERFSGMVVIDDPHKPDEVHSDTMRDKVISNYNETIKQRPRGPNVPIVFIGQRLHEADLAAFLIESKDGIDWNKIVLKAIDDAGNALYPEVDPLEKLRREQKVNPYVFSSQFQQNPQPIGGGIFQKEDFVLLPQEPHILSTFITADTACSDKDWADATVFSFWGIYKIAFRGIDTGLYGLHWLNCEEMRIEPKDLEDAFLNFYATCMRHRVKPKHALIEKASTGITLISVLKQMQGLRIIEVERTSKSGNKTARFLACQPYVAGKHVSMTDGARHVPTCLEHMRKITSNNTHAHDDIADTMEMAVKHVLIDGSLLPRETQDADDVMASLMSHSSYIDQLRLQV